MTDLDQNALDAAAQEAFESIHEPESSRLTMTASMPWTAIGSQFQDYWRRVVRAAINVYLAKRYDAVMECAETDIARSISEIVTAAVEKEREECALIADAYADKNITMAGDSVLHDPVLSSEALTVANIKKSNDLMIEGCIHSSMLHASQNIAAAIRSRSSQGEP